MFCSMIVKRKIFTVSLFARNKRSGVFISKSEPRNKRVYVWSLFTRNFIHFLSCLLLLLHTQRIRLSENRIKIWERRVAFCLFCEKQFLLVLQLFSKGYAGDSTLDLLPTLLMVAKTVFLLVSVQKVCVIVDLPSKHALWNERSAESILRECFQSRSLHSVPWNGLTSSPIGRGTLSGLGITIIYIYSAFVS